MRILCAGNTAIEAGTNLRIPHDWNGVGRIKPRPVPVFEHVVQLGMGGSVLGARIWQEAAGLEQLVCCDEPHNLTRVLDVLNGRILVVAASLSGNTVEVLHMMDTMLEAGKTCEWLALCNHFDRPVAQKVYALGGEVVEASRGPGGRYTVLQAANLVSPILAGLAVQDLSVCRGDRKQAVRAGKESAARKCRIAALWNYTGRWIAVHPWWNQLVAESLGQAGYGVVPLAERGPHAQHSVGQLLLDGDLPSANIFVVPHAPATSGEVLVNDEAKASALALHASGQQVLWVECEDTLTDLGDLLLFLMDYVASWGLAAGVDPFGQPAVERIKKQLGDAKLHDRFAESFAEKPVTSL